MAAALLGGAACHGTAAPAGGGATDGGTDASNDGAAPFTEEAMRAALLAYNTKYCTAFQKFDPVVFRFLMGTMDKCLEAPVSQLTTNFAFSPPGALLANTFGAVGATLTPDGLRACAAALDLSTPRAWVEFDYELLMPDACRAIVYGRLADRSTCAAWNQCESGRCYPTQSGGGPNACGACLPVKPLGGDCSKANMCAPGAVCWAIVPDASKMQCITPADVDKPCGPYQPCRFDLVCEQNDPDAGAGSGTCRPPPDGDACDPRVAALASFFVSGHAHSYAPAWGAAGCSGVPAMRQCNEATGKCEAFPFGHEGDACDLNRPCDFGARCVEDLPTAGDDAGGDAGPPTFHCRPLGQPGQPCDPSVDPFNSLKCTVGVCYAGVCQENGAAQCSPPSPLP